MSRLKYSVIEWPKFGRKGIKEGTLEVQDKTSFFFVFGTKIHAHDLIADVECSSGKDAYFSYEDIENALKMRDRHSPPKRIYKCSECGCYHFTAVDSMMNRTHPYNRSIEKRNAKLIIEPYKRHEERVDDKSFSMRRFRNRQSKHCIIL